MLSILEDISDAIFGNKRLESLQHFASSKSFKYSKRANPHKLPIDVQKMDFFDAKAKPAIKGYLYKLEEDTQIFSQIFDYYPNNYGSKVSTILLLNHDDMDLPYFKITPKGGFSRLGSIFSAGEWASVDKDFDKSFAVESVDMNFMNMMITIQFAEVMSELKTYTVEGRGPFLAVYKPSLQIDIVDLDNRYDSAAELIDIILHDHSREIV